MKTNSEPISFAALRRRLADPGPWTERFRRLAEDIDASTASTPAAEDNLTCDDFEVALEILLAGESLNHPTQLYRAHLATCQNCRASFALLRAVHEQDRTGQPPADFALTAPSLSFLRTPTAATPWFTRLQSRLTDSKFGLQISIQFDYLRSTHVSPRAPLAVRADAAIQMSPAPQLLMSDTLSIGDQIVAVEVSLLRNDQTSKDLALQATITGSQGLPPLIARLTWADTIYVAPVDADGYARFADLPLDDLPADLSTLEIVFETHDPTNESV